MSLAGTYTDDERRHFLRYTRTRHWPMLQRFPVADDLHTELLAQMLASTPETIRALLGSLREETRSTAARMLADDRYRHAVTALPFLPGERIVAVGDSVTADRLGWFELLAASLRQTAAPAVSLINLGVSGNTTADVIERFDQLEAARPNRVLLMIGTNDARAHGRAGRHRMATTDETERNLRALIDLVTHDLTAAVTVITPPAADQNRIDATFGDTPVHWRATAVAEVARAIRKAAPNAVDVHEVTQARVTGDLLESDGIHPTPAGQRFILTHIVDRLRTAE